MDTTPTIFNSGNSSMTMTISPSIVDNTKNDNSSYVIVAALGGLAGAVLLVIITIVGISVILYIHVHHKKSHTLNEELTLVRLPTATSNIYELPSVSPIQRVSTINTTVSGSDKSVNHPEDVLSVINFHNTTSSPKHTEPVLPSLNTMSLETPSQIVIPSTDTGSETELDNISKQMDDDYMEDLHVYKDSCVGQSISLSGSYSLGSSFDQGGSIGGYCQSAMVSSFTSVHGYSSQYGQIGLYPITSNNDSTHPITDPTTKDLPAQEIEEQSACLVYLKLAACKVLSPLMANEKVVGLTPAEDGERFEYINGVIDCHQGDDSLCVPDFKMVVCTNDNDTLLPNNHGFSTQSGSPVASPYNKSSLLMSTTTDELSNSLSTDKQSEHHNKAKLDVSDWLYEKMTSSTKVINEEGLSNISLNEVAVHEKTVSHTEEAESKEAFFIDDRKTTKGLNEQAMMPAISPHQNDNDEDSIHR